MVKQVDEPPTPSDITALEAGPVISIIRKVWLKATSAEMQLQLLKRLKSLNLGLREDEKYFQNLANKKKGGNSKSKNLAFIQNVMAEKVVDADKTKREADFEKVKIRREIDSAYGKNSSGTRNLMKMMRKETLMLKRNLEMKNNEKIQHLQEEFRKEANVRTEIPEKLKKYEDLSIYSEVEGEENQEIEPEITIVGENIEIDEEELSVLRLGPDYAIVEKLIQEDFNVDVEMALCKYRWEIRKTTEEKLDDEEEIDDDEKELHEELEAESRQPFNPMDKTLDPRKMRVTDFKLNTRVHLPKPLSTIQEAKIEIRREKLNEVFNNFINEKCSEKGDQKLNLSKAQGRGLKKLKKRLKDGDLVIFMTDKSGKFAITDLVNYSKMGEVHTSKDIEVDAVEAKKTERRLNGHNSMWIKMAQFGSDWNHQSRMREAVIQNSGLVPNLSLLLKDHKSIKPGEIPKTRPVVGAFQGMGVGLSEMLSGFLEAMADCKENTIEVISTEDFVNRINEFNKVSCEGENLVIVGADATALFPSMWARTTGRTVGKAALKTTLVVKGLNYREMARYVAMEMDRFEIRYYNLDRIAPRRRFKKGTKPGVTGKDPLSKHTDSEEQWIFPPFEPTEQEKKALLAASLDIGVRTAFENHLYQFGGKIYHQKVGGPIGLRVTMAAARVVMGEWGEKLLTILKDEGMEALLSALYVDDARLVVPIIERGIRWDNKRKKLTHKQEWLDEDLEMNDSDTRRTSKVIREIMNSVFRDINFEMEISEDFATNRLPTLDFEMWMEENKIRYSFFEKAMKTPYCIMEPSAMAIKSKISILAQDLIRRMLNTEPDISQPERNEIVENFIKRLQISGYSVKQVKEIIESGLKGYESKKERSEKEGKPLYRAAKKSLASRQKKKLLGKTNWYKDKKTKMCLKDGKTADPVTLCEKGKPKKMCQKDGKLPPVKTNQQDGSSQEGRKVQPKTISVLFVPRTENGELARRLRQAEEEMSAITGDKIKIVERAGRKLKSILLTANPWSGGWCGRVDCLACEHCEAEDSKCGQRNIVYKTSCLQCKQRGTDRCYYGESARTAYERGSEHLKDYLDEGEDSHMLKHHVTDHPELKDPIDFSMKVLKTHKTAFSRQVHEAVLIKMNERNDILNSKGEFNRCQLPRLSVMMGEREVIPKEREMTQEEEEDSMKREKRKSEVYSDEACPPPSKRQKVWKKEIQNQKRKKRKRAEENEIEVIDDENSLPAGRKRIRFSQVIEIEKIPKISDNNVPEGWRPNNNGQKDGRQDQSTEVLKHQQQSKISEIIQCFDKVNEIQEMPSTKNQKTNSKVNNSEENIQRKNKIFKFSAVSQGGTPKSKYSSTRRTENVGREILTEYKANSKPNFCKVMLTTTSPSPPPINYED